jgi:hypothetical protein
MRARFILPVLITMIILLFASGCEQEPFSVESVDISKGIGEDFAPIDIMDEFPAGISIIYISVKVINMTPEDKLSVNWNYLETGDEINTTDFSPEETGSGYIGFNITVDQGFPTGDYNVLVYVNDELYETVEFLVK